MMQEFVDQINKSARSATEDMHTALPGEIKSYDPGKGVATVLPKAKFTKPDGSTMDFPEISGVPVMFPQSKNVTIVFGENPKVNYSGQNKSPVTRMAIAAMLRRELWESREYLRQKQEAAEKGEYFAPDFEKECYLPVLRGDIPLKAHVHRVDDIFTAIRIAKEFGIKMTMDHCSEGHLVAEELAKEGFPAIVGPDLTSRNKIEVQNMSFKTAGVLNRAGVMVAITTDHPVSQIQTLPLCAGLAVKAGLPMEEGFRAITIYPAKICGVADRIGSLEVGKDADIAIFDGNPMEIFTRTLYTIINGEIVYCNVPRE